MRDGFPFGGGALLVVYAPGSNNGSGMKVYSSSTVERLWFNVACSLPCCSLPAFGSVLAAPAFGIALGLAALTSADLATFALRAAFTSEAARRF